MMIVYHRIIAYPLIESPRTWIIELYHLDPWVTGISAHLSIGPLQDPHCCHHCEGFVTEKTMASNWAHRNNKNRSQKINRQSVKQNVSRNHFVKHQFSDSTGVQQETPAKLGFCCHSKSAKRHDTLSGLWQFQGICWVGDQVSSSELNV